MAFNFSQATYTQWGNRFTIMTANGIFIEMPENVYRKHSRYGDQVKEKKDYIDFTEVTEDDRQKMIGKLYSRKSEHDNYDDDCHYPDEVN